MEVSNDPTSVDSTDDQEDDSYEVEMPSSQDPDLFDPACDPDNPKAIQFQDVSAASFLLHGGINRTPCEVSSCFFLIFCLRCVILVSIFRCLECPSSMT